jgi:predicted MPP superfamily phosphohydrolase
VFIFIALFVLLGASFATVATWIHFTGVVGWAWTGAPLALVAGFVGIVFASFRWQHGFLRWAGKITAGGLGFLNLAMMAALACWLTLGLSRAFGLALNARSVAMLLYGAAVLATIYGLVNAAWLRVTRVTVRLPNLPVAWTGRTVALVSDIHVGNIRGAGFVRRIVARLNQLEPAAVFIAGDMFDGAKVDIINSVQPWAALKARAGIYFSSGNHDEFNERAPYLAALRQVGARVLDNEKVVVEGLQIVGVHDGETRQAAGYQDILRRVGLDRERASVLVAHQPRNLKIAEEAGLSLQLAGHTHAGQFWPWSGLVRKIYGPFSYGLNRFGGLQVYTSSGAGSWGPPLRVGTRSEIVLLKLEPEIRNPDGEADAK